MEFGVKCVVAFWVVSLTVQVAKMAGWITTTWCFLSIWGLTTLVEKTLKVIPNEWGNSASNWIGRKLITRDDTLDDTNTGGDLPQGLV